MPFVKPSNAVLVGGAPIVEELVTEGTSCKARLFVKRGTADHQVQPAGDGEQKPLGILDREKDTPIDTAFPAGKSVRALKAPAVVVAVLASGNNVVKGAPLVCAAGGKLKAAALISVSVPAGATNVTSNAAQPDLLLLKSCILEIRPLPLKNFPSGSINCQNNITNTAEYALQSPKRKTQPK